MSVRDRAVRFGEDELKILATLYKRNGIGEAIEDRIKFLVTQLGYTHYARRDGNATPEKHPKALERTYIVEKC